MPKLSKYKETSSISIVAEKLGILFNSNSVFRNHKILEIKSNGIGSILFEIKSNNGIELTAIDIESLNKKVDQLGCRWFIYPVNQKVIHLSVLEYT